MRKGLGCTVFAAALMASSILAQDSWTLIGWNDLGMHCMDGSDFSVFSILPPYNTVNSHLLHNGRLVTDTNLFHVTYRAVADPQGSINSTAADKINFWEYEHHLFGVELAPDVGLTGQRMPGQANNPQPTHFSGTRNWFAAEGIPISPYDDAGVKNYYPMFRFEARNASDSVVAQADVVLPVSDEMHCSACHHSGSGPAAEPSSGWVWGCDRDRDFKLNILRLHDELRAASPTYATALSTAGYHAQGLYATVRVDGKAVICAQCHRSNALPGMGQADVSYFTSAIHARHAYVEDPTTGMALENSANRDACYRCHPGSATRCLRGTMGKAVGANGDMSMSCQSCHGSMIAVGNASRDGWFDEPNCQSCHTGTATDNNGQIRYTSVFASPGTPRVVVNQTFATDPDTPAAGKSLYRFSAGHRNLQCSACHGSPHAIYPSFHGNDNVQNQALQGHEGTLAECTACHTSQPRTFLGGPHGMHPVGVSDFAVKNDHQEQWFHGEAKEDGSVGLAACQACHGADYRGTVLSRSHADRGLDTEEYGVKQFWRGYQVGCYTCHNGPNSEAATPNDKPLVSDTSVTTTANVAKSVTLNGTDGDSLTWRIVSQPKHGTVALSGNTATYYPFANFAGADSFTFAAWDGELNSNLGTASVTVNDGTPVLTCNAVVPSTRPVHDIVPFRAFATLSNTAGAISYTWTFGDQTAGASSAGVCHRYGEPGTYAWTSIVHAASVSVTNSGTITITDTVIDEDGDTIADYWEFAWFGRLGVVDATTDSDGDGLLDRGEWGAGTGPTNSQSLLVIADVNAAPGGRVIVTWSSVSNRTYDLVRIPDLLQPTVLPVAAALLATPPLNVYTDMPATVSGFYRVETSLQAGAPALP